MSGEHAAALTGDKEALSRVSLLIEGNLMSGKNSTKRLKRGDRVFTVMSDEAVAWKQKAILQIRNQMNGRRPFKGPVRISGIVHYRSVRSDLSIELLQDALQGSRRGEGLVYFDDNQVQQYGFWEKRLDTKHPRVEVFIEALTPQNEELFP
jgi:Holliday junction resolvase RusA-like endonuclease